MSAAAFRYRGIHFAGVFLIAALFIGSLLTSACLAEEAWSALLDRADLGRLQEWAGAEAGFDVRGFAKSLLTGEAALDMHSAEELLDRLLRSTRARMLALAGNLTLPLALELVLRLLFGDGGAARAPGLLCVVCVAATLSGLYMESSRIAAALIASLSEASGCLAPVLTACAVLSGAPAASGIATPLATLCADVIQNWFAGWGVRLCAVAAAVALSDGLAGGRRLDRLFRFVRSAQHWLLTGAMLAFSGLMSVQGVLCQTGDSVAARAAQNAIESAVPVIGGELSDILGTLTVSAGAIRGAVGVTGLAALARVCLGPLARVLAASVSVKLAAAIVEPVAGREPARLFARFGEVLDMLLAVCTASAVLVALLFGGGFALIGSIAG